MAAAKKYAGLPDLDDAGTELYQTPGLVDDASTVQTSTLRTESPTFSEEANENVDHTGFDREGARRRFEPSVVDARDVNFSYAVSGNRKSYTSRYRRRRRTRKSNGLGEYGDSSGESDVEEEESLTQRLARLRREAEELRLEIEQRDKDDGEFQDSFEHQQGGADNEENESDLSRDAENLSRMLDRLQSSARSKHETLEQEFNRRLGQESVSKNQSIQSIGRAPNDTTFFPATNAITVFSDRLSVIETALGLSTISPASNPTAILPTLETLTSQINLLNTTISPRQPPAMTSQSTSTNLTPQMPHLDILQSRLHALHQSAASLLNARKSAQTALTDLETVRLRGIRSADHLARYQTLANRRANRPTSTTLHSPVDDDNNNNDNNNNKEPHGAKSARPISLSGGPPRPSTMIEEVRERIEIADEIVTPLFLEEQAEKIKALYSILPTIQNLQPLLPVVLERLRGLSVVHADAAGARQDMDDLEGRLRDWEAEVTKWRAAVEGVEGGIEELKVVMKENVEVVGGLVRGVEERVGRLEAK